MEYLTITAAEIIRSTNPSGSRYRDLKYIEAEILNSTMIYVLRCAINLNELPFSTARPGSTNACGTDPHLKDYK